MQFSFFVRFFQAPALKAWLEKDSKVNAPWLMKAASRFHQVEIHLLAAKCCRPYMSFDDPIHFVRAAKALKDNKEHVLVMYKFFHANGGDWSVDGSPLETAVEISAPDVVSFCLENRCRFRAEYCIRMSVAEAIRTKTDEALEVVEYLCETTRKPMASKQFIEEQMNLVEIEIITRAEVPDGSSYLAKVFIQLLLLHGLLHGNDYKERFKIVSDKVSTLIFQKPYEEYPERFTRDPDFTIRYLAFMHSLGVIVCTLLIETLKDSD